MRKTFLAVALTALLGLTAGACGGGSDDPEGSSKPTTPAGGDAAAATINASGTTWEPDEVAIKAGETVKWDVKGSIVHDLKGDEGVEHKAASKYVVTHTYEKPGTYSYQCTVHPGMTGTVTVTP
ncbi:MAG: cupredoxin domain-containing protein [Acidimicrobiales bacterium]|nr:cupredoxin domain-containing protein [Acidimicrobiales bacterium]